MDLEYIILGEESHTKKGNYHMILFICRCFKNDTDELTKQKLTHIENKHGYQSE